jgi:hypothetical protein
VAVDKLRRALIVGCARGVWEEAKRAQQMCEFERIYCVKQMGVHWPTAFHTWVTLHPESMCGENDYGINFIAEREAKGFPNGYEIVAPLSEEVGTHGAKGRVTRRVSFAYKGMTSSAGSGLYGAKVALDDGFDHIVLAGIPMDKSAGHFLTGSKNSHGQIRGQYWLGRDEFTDGYLKMIPHMRGKVKSMSGETAMALGLPSPSWLAESQSSIGNPVVRNAQQL